MLSRGGAKTSRDNERLCVSFSLFPLMSFLLNFSLEVANSERSLCRSRPGVVVLGTVESSPDLAMLLVAEAPHTQLFSARARMYLPTCLAFNLGLASLGIARPDSAALLNSLILTAPTLFLP